MTMSVDHRIIERLSALPADQHAEFRSALTVAAIAYKRDTAGLGRVWSAFADCGRTDGAIGTALDRCTIDDLEHLRAVFIGAELGSRRNTRLRDAWGACRDVVVDELARRKPAPAVAVPAVVPAIQEIGPQPAGTSRTTSVLALLRANPQGLGTRDITTRLGGDAARKCLERMRRAGLIDVRSGRNYLGANARTTTQDGVTA